MSKHKRLTIFGITGSIGTSTVDVVEHFSDMFSIVACSAGKNTDKLNRILQKHTCITKAAVADKKSEKLVEHKSVTSGLDGMLSLLDVDTDLIVMALAGKSGWKITLEAIKKGIPVALANKESLVIAGMLLGRDVTCDRNKIIPVDSEHAAILEVLEHRDLSTVSNVFITASGGALRDMTKDQAWKADAAKALSHPVWDMGQKVTVDSATMLNKGLELIEAYWLFRLEPTQFKAVIHPEVGVHAFAELIDGSIISQISASDMRIPIARALSYPETLPLKKIMPHLSYEITNQPLSFYDPDREKYPLLACAENLLENQDYSGMIAYAVSDEIAVEYFLENKIDIDLVNQSVLYSVDRFSRRKVTEISELEQVIEEIVKSTRDFIEEKIHG